MKIKLIYLIVFTLASVHGFAQVDRSKFPEPGPAPEIQLGEYESFTLKNGLKVYVVENDKLPRVAFSLVLDRDPISEGDAVGYVSMAGELMRRGTTTRPKEQLDQEIDFMGASLSVGSSSVYAASLTKHSEKLVEIMADVVLNPAFPAEELEKIKKQTLSGLEAGKDDPNTIASNVAQAVVYGKDHPYGEIMTEETVQNADLEKIKNYYQTYWKPNIAYLAIVGDITKKDAEKLVRKHFEDWEKGEVPSQEYDQPQMPEETTVALVDRPASVQSIVNITYPIVLEPGHPDVIKARVANQILGGGSSARLFMNLRETHGYTYGSYSSISSDKLVGRFNANASVRNEVTDSAVHELMAELKGMVAEKVTEEELLNAKNYITGSFARSLESPSTIASFALNIEQNDLPKDYYANYLKNVQAVTLEDVQATADKYIKPENAHIIVVGKGADIADKLKQFGELEYYDIYGDKYTPSTKSDLPADLTAEKVIENYITALGGEEKLKSVEDVKIDAKASMQGMELQITQMMKSPNKSYQDVKMGEMELSRSVSDGSKAAMFQQGNAMPMEEKAMQDIILTSGMFPELHYNENGIKSTLGGIENVEGKDAYMVEVELPTGKKLTQYYDKESGLKVRESQTLETPQGSMTLATDFMDYKEYEGIKFPQTILLPLGPGQKLKTEVISVELNTGLNDDLFAVE